jgi:uncharacterized membrane protein YeaQ/YmgE (transglycosylase-associated protein family)
MTLATLVLADISISASTFIWWIVIGLIIGLIASFIMRGGYGLLVDIIIGIVGAILGGIIASLLGIAYSGLGWTIFFGVIGAIILIAILRAISGGYHYRRRRL